MKKAVYLLVTITFLVACNAAKNIGYNPNKKFSATALREDFTILQKILRANHPSLYWNTTEDSVNSYFTLTEKSLTDSLTESQFKNKIAWTVAKIRCGHTSVLSSKQFTSYYTKKRLPQFPLTLKIWKDSAVVTGTLIKGDSTLKRGTIVTAINGRTSADIIDSICSLVGTDGNADVFKYQAMSFNFPAYYRNAFGIDNQYLVNYIDSIGLVKTATLKNFAPLPDTGNKKTAIEATRPLTRKQQRELKMNNLRNIKVDTINNTALLSINTFSDGKLIRFFNKSFKQIKKQAIQNVVIDLRLNSGGSVLACTRLSQYLINKPFNVA
ncbi:MAG TPA: S41 family peptidase, partial [Segetibacter sp.]